MARTGAVAIVPAAGVGRRLGQNKTMARIMGKPLLQWTLEALAASPLVDAIYPVLNEEDMAEADSIVSGISKVKSIVKGGQERQDSVRNALYMLRGKIDETSIVLVHDGARPLVTADIIERCILGLKGAHGAIVAVPPKDTVKETDGRDEVAATLNRDCLRLVQTPQAFMFKTLLAAYEAAEREGYIATDDAALVEWAGGQVKVVMGSYENIKITTPEDIPLAEHFLKRRGM